MIRRKIHDETVMVSRLKVGDLYYSKDWAGNKVVMKVYLKIETTVWVKPVRWC